MTIEATMYQADLSWIQFTYTSRLLSGPRQMPDAYAAARVHAECWNFTLNHPETRAVFLCLPTNEITWLRDVRLAGIAAEHYGFELEDLVGSFRHLVAQSSS